MKGETVILNFIAVNNLGVHTIVMFGFQDPQTGERWATWATIKPDATIEQAAQALTETAFMLRAENERRQAAHFDKTIGGSA
jgi:hypothetical protein